MRAGGIREVSFFPPYHQIIYWWSLLKSDSQNTEVLSHILTHSKRLQRSRTLTVPMATSKSPAAPVVEIELDTPTYLEVPDFQRVAILGDYASGVTIVNNTTALLARRVKIGDVVSRRQFFQTFFSSCCAVSLDPPVGSSFSAQHQHQLWGRQWLWISLTLGVSGSLASCEHRAMIGGHLRAGRGSGFSCRDLWPLQRKTSFAASN